MAISRLGGVVMKESPELTPFQHLQNVYRAAVLARLTAQEHEQIRRSADALHRFIEKNIKESAPLPPDDLRPLAETAES